MRVELEPTCPYCDEVLEPFETIDIEMDENSIRALTLGECPICKKEFKYFEYYIYSDFEMLGEND